MSSAGPTIAPDYARPAALMVPHCRSTIRGFLEAIAAAASEHVGVILLASDPAETQAFVARQRRPERFSIVAGSYNTPWIRDRAPIPLRCRGTYEWVQPHLPKFGRSADDVLFATISARQSRPTPLLLAHGNLVAGLQPGVLCQRRLGTADGPSGGRTQRP